MRFDRRQLRLHLLWAVPSLLVTAGLMVWYVWASTTAGRWLGGGSLPGLVCGLAAGVIIAFEMLLWPRKALRRLRLLAAKHWLAAHIWFGLCSLPLAWLHSGFHLGGALPATFIVLFTLTILSGVYGLIVQNILPKILLRDIPAETICSQIGHVSQINVADVKHVLTAVSGPNPKAVLQAGELPHQSDPEQALELSGKQAVVVGAVRDVRRARGRTLQTQLVQADRADSMVLWRIFAELEPYMLRGAAAGGPVSEAGRARAYFAETRSACTAAAEPAIQALESCCEQRRQFDIQQRLHNWLHAWLPIHIALSVAVSILLVVHVITALRYW